MKKSVLRFFPSILVLLFCTAPTCVLAGEFDFADPKGVNTVQFFLDSPLEPIMGTASEISGTLSYDKEDPAATRGTIEFPASKITVPNKKMTSVMHSEDWLNVEANPTVSFEITGGEAGEDTMVTLSGTMTLAGVSKEFTAPAHLSLVEGGAKARGAGEGDLLVVRSSFIIKRSDYGIKAGVPGLTAKVAENIEIRLGIVGYAK